MPNANRRQILTCQVCLLLIVICATGELQTFAQPLPLLQRAANTAITFWPESPSERTKQFQAQHSNLALMLNGMGAVWYSTADGTYYRYEKSTVDALLAGGGATDLGNDMAMARPVLLLARVTQDGRYFREAALLDQRLSTETQDWQADPAEIYESAPFYAEYAEVLGKREDFAKVAEFFSKDSRGKKPSLMETAGRRALNARDMGWYMAALVDALPHYPHDDADRKAILQILNRTATTIVSFQDPSSGLWHESLGRARGPNDPIATCLFIYALQKGTRLGYLAKRYSRSAARAWQGTLKYSVQTEGLTSVSFKNPERNGGRGTSDNGREQAGAFLLASAEMSDAQQAMLARGQLVMLDSWFNSQRRTNPAGQNEYFHYKWSDYSDSGYSLFGSIFSDFGAELATLSAPPRFDNLSHAQYYIIVSPDLPVKNPHPHYVQEEDASYVAEWVKRGGVLILMENDPPNADIEHLNLIADRFGIHFNAVLSHHVAGDDFAAGTIAVNGSGPIFRQPHALYMKDTCTLSLKGSARALLTDKGDIVIASARYGRGMVVAVVDPWLYNEYTDGRKKPPAQDNYMAGREFVKWLVDQRQAGSSIGGQGKGRLGTIR